MDTNKFFEMLHTLQDMDPNNPTVQNVRNYMLESLGDDELEIVNFINSLSTDDASWLTEIYEELVGKFPGNTMEQLFETKVHI